MKYLNWPLTVAALCLLVTCIPFIGFAQTPFEHSYRISVAGDGTTLYVSEKDQIFGFAIISLYNGTADVSVEFILMENITPKIDGIFKIVAVTNAIVSNDGSQKKYEFLAQDQSGRIGNGTISFPGNEASNKSVLVMLRYSNDRDDFVSFSLND